MLKITLFDSKQGEKDFLMSAEHEQHSLTESVEFGRINVIDWTHPS